MSQQISAIALEEMIQSGIDSLKEKSKKNKRFFQGFTAISILLGAAITLTLGISVTGDLKLQKNIALVFGVILTVVNGWMAIFDYKKLWMRQKITLLSFYQLRNDLKHTTSVEESYDQKDIDRLFEAYQGIWDKDGNEWLNIYKESADVSNTNHG
ncbi:DUF4231 domain-containing protein [Serratia sp. NPDC087055]|uniref:DUF4231 domain-containing protein n=1 Tax=Serratia sp. NPDC087055 TaxID=3364516 RepID=UPI00384B17FC